MHTALPPLTVSPARADDPDVLALQAAAEAELHVRYPGDDDLGPAVDALVWLVARRDDAGVGLIALCALEPGMGEIKRMYVADEARRTGVARALIVAVEDAAREQGMHTLRLETGTRQPEAMTLYTACGYVAIANYGYWGDHPLSRCYEKALA